MPPLPVVSGDDVRRVLERLGWELAGQEGSHMLMRRPQGGRIPVPRHRELKPGTLRQIIRLSGLTVDEFVAMLER